MNNVGERRNVRRVALQPGSCAAVGDQTVMGRIVDISWKGLLLEYANLNSQQDAHVCDGNMALVGNGVIVKGLKFHVIEESPIQQEVTFSLLDMRSVRVMFEDISSEQTIALENYISVNSGESHQRIPKVTTES